MFQRLPDRPVSVHDDDFEDIPSQGSMPKWFGGILVPLAFATYGIRCLATGHAVFYDGPMSLDLHGHNAVALAASDLSIALFLHCHYFWGNIYHLSFLAVLGKILSLITFILSLAYLIVRVGVLGKQ